MDLKSGYPYWAVKNGLPYGFPRLAADAACDVLVVGGGITGALIARAAAGAGFDTIVVERRDIGWGSTAASTALLQYEIDAHLTDLAAWYGETRAVAVYRACADAVDRFGDIARVVRGAGFRRNASLYMASRTRHRGDLRAEFDMRLRHGFDVEWLEPEQIRERFGFGAPGAILSGVGARVDPYRFAGDLLQRLQRGGTRVFDRTEVEAWQLLPRQVLARCRTGSIRCSHLIVATGYEAQRWIPERVARNRSSYAVATDPLDPRQLGELGETMVWETSRPYTYLRGTNDHRLLIGGEDDAVDVPALRERRLGRKARALMKRLAQLRADLDLVGAFAWAGTFAETADALPYFGAHPSHGKRVLFAMAYGGNGITYSVLGAELLVDAIRGRRNTLARLFSFDRKRA
jgi:glycine/D-amino acid oxidase-like deaminating enzyme